MKSLLFGLAIFCAVPAICDAQWTSLGRPICVDPAIQYNPQIVSDGSGGAYILWQDHRVPGSGIFLQRVLANGQIPAPWPINGLLVAVRNTDNWVGLVPDGTGGVFIGYEDIKVQGRAMDIYCCHVLQDGTKPPGWSGDGIPLCELPEEQRGVMLCPDGTGGVFAAWTDSRDGIPNTSIYAQHLGTDGGIVPGWEQNGILVDDSPNTGPYTKSSVVVVSDRAGGMIVAWTDSRSWSWNNGLLDVYVVRITGNGEFPGGWPTGGIRIGPQTGDQETVGLLADGSGGAYVLFWNSSTLSIFAGDICLARVNSRAQFPMGWTQEGVVVSEAPDTQQGGRMALDGSGGVVIVWEDYRSHGAEIYGARFLGNGALAPGWTPNGTPVVLHAGFQYSPEIASDHLGGFYASWLDDRSGVTDIYVSHMSASGQPFPGWSDGGMRVAEGPLRSRASTGLVADASGGAITCWTEGDGNGNIYAQHFSPDGPTPVLPFLVDAEAEGATVRLRWSGALHSPSVERSIDANEWTNLGSPSSNASGDLTYEDRDLAPGRYAYRLRYTEGVTEPAWVEVLGTELRLAGFVPNPGRGDLPVSFSLPGEGATRLELFAASGRRVAARELGSLGPGTHQIPLNPERALPGGVYWLRLTQGVRSVTTKGIVLGS